MDFEPGPLALFTTGEIPQGGDPAAFSSLVVDQVVALNGAAEAIGWQQGQFAGAGVNELDPRAAQLLGAAASEHARQSSSSDSTIGGVAASAEALEGEIGGLSGELAQDLAVSVPAEPTIPPDGYGRGGVPEDAPQTEWDAIVTQQFRLYGGRVPTNLELVYARRFQPDVAALRAWIQSGAPMDAPPPAPPETPPPSPPPPSPIRWSYHLHNDPYGGVVGQWAHQYYDNPNINPNAVIQDLIAAARARLGSRAPQDDYGVLYLLATGQA